jgi:hypothetical protein
VTLNECESPSRGRARGRGVKMMTRNGI